jgi:hypothetical protein
VSAAVAAHPAAAPSLSIANQKITLAPVGSFADTSAKLTILAIGVTPLPQNTLASHGQGLNIEASV